MTSIWGTDAKGNWRPLAPTGYSAEAVLHDLVRDAPQMLPLAGSPRLTVLGREVGLGAGVADLIAVESSGRLVIIEVKLATNAEARRAVVAQVLSYAGYLQGPSPEQLESQVLAKHLAPLGSVLAAVEADPQQYGIEPTAFRDGLARTLADGSFRLVFVLDSAPDELVQVIGYLQSVADKIDIDLVTVTAYHVNGAQVLVPQRIEPARRTSELTDAEVSDRQGVLSPGSAEFRTAIADAPADKRDVLCRLTQWAEELENAGLVKLVSYRGKNGGVTLLPRLASDNAGLVTVYADHNLGPLQFWQSVFARRAPNSMHEVEAALGAKLARGNFTTSVSEPLLDALTGAYREAVGEPATAPSG